ncbi:hypothetical protein V1503_24070 [Bacillus sp. SCS-151]|uniref:hypothetical protein n=1 Tax=Nanhaiella sioensis TaxID=3115293 RepID=UPI00397D7F69
MTTLEERSKQKKKEEQMEIILNHYVDGEVYISTPSKVWKQIVLNHFNKVYRNELTVDELLTLLQREGVQFNQSLKLVRYPVVECLRFISACCNKDIDIS